jgi:archaellum component FlaC
MKLRVQLTDTGTLLSQAQAQNMAGEVQASRTIQKLKHDLENKDIEMLRINSDIEWANERIQKLEQALDKATLELKARSDLVEKWETKTVELSKKIEDLEK